MNASLRRTWTYRQILLWRNSDDANPTPVFSSGPGSEYCVPSDLERLRVQRHAGDGAKRRSHG